jgi:hypothetical protein
VSSQQKERRLTVVFLSRVGWHVLSSNGTNSLHWAPVGAVRNQYFDLDEESDERPPPVYVFGIRSVTVVQVLTGHRGKMKLMAPPACLHVVPAPDPRPWTWTSEDSRSFSSTCQTPPSLLEFSAHGRAQFICFGEPSRIQTHNASS